MLRKRWLVLGVVGGLLGLSGSTAVADNSDKGRHRRTTYWLSEETDSRFVTREGEEFGPDTPLELGAALSGANEVGGGDPDGTGSATVSLRPNGEVCWELSVAGIQLPAAAAHIHSGAAGVNGGVVVGLSPPDAAGVASGCTMADATVVEAIADDPGAYYVNVHTADFPDGAVRGQLEETFSEPRVGDRFFASENLFASDANGAKGEQIGTDVVQCTFGVANTLQCSATATIDGRGQVHFTATITFDPTSEEAVPFDVAIVGGTGEFADAGGDATLTELPGTEPFQTRWAVRLLHLKSKHGR